MYNTKRKIPEFILEYDRKLKNAANTINKHLSQGKTILCNKEPIKKIEFESFKDNEFGMSEAYVITESGKRYNSGSDIFKLLTFCDK